MKKIFSPCKFNIFFHFLHYCTFSFVFSVLFSFHVRTHNLFPLFSFFRLSSGFIFGQNIQFLRHPSLFSCLLCCPPPSSLSLFICSLRLLNRQISSIRYFRFEVLTFNISCYHRSNQRNCKKDGISTWSFPAAFSQRIKSTPLTAKEALVAEYILNNFLSVCYVSTSELARILGVSDATVSRTSKVLGYRSFLDSEGDTILCLSESGLCTAWLLPSH